MNLAAVIFAGAVAGAAPGSTPGHPGAGVPDREAEILALAGKFPTLVPYHTTGAGHRFAFVFASAQGMVHHVVSDSTGLRETWRSFSVGQVSRLSVDDIDRDGSPEVVALSGESVVYVWSLATFDLVWESRRENLGDVATMALADVDADEPLEILLVARNRLVAYDGKEFVREREGRDRLSASAILVGDVDGDGRSEIVTNDGFVFDARTLAVEWTDDRGFGYPMVLFDVNNDGRPEVVGEVSGALRFWDLRARRELWWPVPPATTDR